MRWFRIESLVTGFHLTDKVVRGNIKNDTSLTVVQLKDDSQLAEGESYVLALGNDYEEGLYHVIGGDQGIFSIVNGKLCSQEESFQEELQQIILTKEATAEENDSAAQFR
ncbi:MAG: hypothetical protein E7255_09120 [Lachnospiraceae bacterium]|nr:hypothetical protein [Lachnospiraceae bacterium]